MKFLVFKESIKEDDLQYFCGGEDIHMTLFLDLKKSFKVMGFGNNKENSIHDFWNNLENYDYHEYLSDCLKLVTGSSKAYCKNQIKENEETSKKNIRRFIKILKG